MIERKRIPELLAVGVSLILLFILYGDVLIHPNDYLFSAVGDGVKNYYSLMYHAKFDSAFWEFTGMNYPYGEHMVYTDGHPLLSWLIGTFGLTDYGIGILNLMMLFGYVLCAFILLKILKHYGIPAGWSVLAAVAIAFLSPQVFRMSGHFSLSYPFAIPGMWYLLIRSGGANAWRWVFGTFLFVLIFFFTHPYLGLILAAFGFAYWLVKFLTASEKGQTILKLSVGVLLPVFLFQFLIWMTDQHAGRLSNPQGFFEYYAGWSSLLVPHHGPMNYVKNVFGFTLLDWETWAYIGSGTILLCLISLALYLRKFTMSHFRIGIRSDLNAFVFAAFLILLFSFCIPFKYDLIKPLLEYLGPIKQFRVLGRFAWVFYYIVTVSAVVWFYRMTWSQGKKKLFAVVFSGAMIFHFFESFPAHRELAFTNAASQNMFRKENLAPPLEEVVDFVNDQEQCTALLVTPFQHMSSESIVLLADEVSNFDALMLSYHCHKPLVNSMSSRMSLSEAIKVNNLFSPDYVEKEYVKDLKPEDKILIVHRNVFVKEGERRMLDRSKKIFENDGYAIYEFDVADWNHRRYFDTLMALDKSAAFPVGAGFRCDTAVAWFLYESYNSDKGTSLSGEGALHGKKEFTNILYKMAGKIDPGTYVVSFWYYLGADLPNMLAVVDMDYKGDRESVWLTQADVKESTHIVGDWCRIKMTFEWTSDSEAATIFLNGNNSQKPYVVDELLIQKKNDRALFKHETLDGIDYVVYNNDRVKLHSFVED